MTVDNEPHHIDRLVGSRIRARRRQLNISQSALAESLDITFQQVQKYERGANRISASKLYETARVLRCSVEHFFTEIGFDVSIREPGEPLTKHDPLLPFLLDEDHLELAEQMMRLNAGSRRAVTGLIRAWVTEDGAP